MTTQPIDPALLKIFCRFCSENEAEAVTQEELDRLLDEGFTNVSHVTPMGAAYLVRALRLSELRAKWLEARLRVRELEDDYEVASRIAFNTENQHGRNLAWRSLEAQRQRCAETKEAYEKAGGVG